MIPSANDVEDNSMEECDGLDEEHGRRAEEGGKRSEGDTIKR